MLLVRTCPLWRRRLVFAPPTVNSTALKVAMTSWDAALGIARMSGTTKQRQHFCSLRLPARYEEARSDTPWMMQGQFIFAKCCPMAKHDGDSQQRMGKWDRLFM